MDNICGLSLSRAAEALKKKEISVSEIVRACLNRVEATEPQIQALLARDGENAMRMAEQMDSAGPDPSRILWGVPVTVKDAISTKGLRTTAASRMLENFVPIYDAFVVRRLREAGAIIIGKNNMDEFAMGSSTENSAYQRTRNPWDYERVPGGSSGGSAASVAAGQCFASLGSDTGGSIRQPASFCGCVGLKPSYGRVSRYGLFAFASSMDQIGPIARHVEDAAIVLQVISGHDARDNTCSDAPVDDYIGAVRAEQGGSPMAGVRIGVPEDFFGSGLDGEVRDACLNALKTTENLGADLVPVELPSPDMASATYYILAMAEASSNLARYDGVRYGRRAADVTDLAELYLKSRSEGFGQEVRRRIMLGSFVLSSGYYDAYFKKAAQCRRIIFDQYHKALEKCDVIAMPVAPSTAWAFGCHDENPLAAYLMDAYTLPVNLAGLPGIALPVSLGAVTHMPVGLQLAGKAFGEAQLLRIAHALEQAIDPIGLPPMSFACEGQGG